MKKVRFDTSGSIALQLKLGRDLKLDQRRPIKLEGWLIGDHICVQKPQADYQGWYLSLYPWGDRLTSEFFAKADAIAGAKAINALSIPWEHVRTLARASVEYRSQIGKVLEIRSDYEIDGLVMPDGET